MKPFIFKDVGDKLNYAIYHEDVENGEKLLGWIRKYCVEHMKNGQNKNT